MRDAGVSEVLGTVLLTATAVVLLSGFGLVVLSSVDSTGTPPTGAFALDAPDGSSTATLDFVSGTSFGLSSARFVLLVDGADRLATYHLDSPAIADRFSPGDTLVMDLNAPLAEGDRVTAMVVDVETGKGIGTTRTTVLGASTLPAFVLSAPSLASPSLSPSLLVADGASLANLTVNVGATYGLDLVDRVTVNLSELGGLSDVAMRDDGQGGDLLASDGIYTVQLTAGLHDFAIVPSTETIALPITVRDILGKTTTTTALITLQSPPQNKVTTGAKWRDLPASPEVRWVNLTDVTLRDALALGNDQVQVRVSDLTDPAVSWSALVSFGTAAECGGTPGVKSIELSRDGVSGSVTYTPTAAGTCLSVGSLTEINIADVTTSLDASGNVIAWSTSGSPSSYVYSAAGLSGTNEATITFLGDTTSLSPSATGIGQADLTWAKLTGTLPSASFTASANLLVLNVDASGSSDPENDPLTYAWNWGDATTTAASGTATAQHTYATAGDYTVTLTVSDGTNAGLSSTVVRINRNPSAAFTYTTNVLTLDVTSTSSDPDGQAIRHDWEWGDGTSTSTFATTAQHTYTTGGSYLVNLTVVDTYQATNRTQQTVTPANVLPQPTLTSNVTSGTEPMDVSFNLGGTDPDGTITSWTLVYGDGNSTSGTTLPVTRTHQYTVGGNYRANLTVTDDKSATNTTSVNLTVNYRPTATLTSDVTSGPAPLAVTYTLGASDVDGTIASWTLQYGDGTSTSGAGTPPATQGKTYLLDGTYTANLTVTDNASGTRTVSRVIMVSTNQPPTSTIVANVTSGNAPLDVMLTLGGADADGSVASWSLSYGDGTSTSGTSLPTIRTHQYAVSGSFQANLTVTDNLGSATTSSTTISVNARPTANLIASPSSGNATLAVTFTLTASDTDGSIASWTLQHGDGTSTSGAGSPPATSPKSYATAGSYQANLTVTDNSGATATASASVFVNARPTATLSSNVTSGNAPLIVLFNVGGSDSDGSVASWTLQYGDGSSASGGSVPTTATHQYNASGTYQANLTVVDSFGGASNVVSVTITVNARPTAAFSVTGTTNLQVNVNAGASTDSDGSVSLYNWQWGDGTTSNVSTATTSHTYSTGGSYQVNLTVVDNSGASSANTATATVTPNRAPTISSVTQTSMTDLNVTLSASASDADGQAITYTYAWGDGAATGASATQSHLYALPGNYTVTVYANDTLGGSASTTKVVWLNQTVYASAADLDFSAPGGTVTGLSTIATADGVFANFTETNTGSTVSVIGSGCDSNFTAPNPCTVGGLTWKVNTTSTGGTTAWTLALDASQGTPVQDGALSFSDNGNGADTGRLNYYFNGTGAASTSNGFVSLNYKIVATAGSGTRSVTAVMVAPNGTAVTIGTTSTTGSTAGWLTFNNTIPANFMTSAGQYLLRIDWLSNKNGDYLYLDNLALNYTATNTYRLQKELSISPVPTSAGLNHYLEISARQSANAENLQVQVFDGTTWNVRATVSSTTLTTYVVPLTTSELDAGTIRVRLVDTTTSGDASASSWLVDYVRDVVRGT